MKHEIDPLSYNKKKYKQNGVYRNLRDASRDSDMNGSRSGTRTPNNITGKQLLQTQRHIKQGGELSDDADYYSNHNRLGTPEDMEESSDEQSYDEQSDSFASDSGSSVEESSSSAIMSNQMLDPNIIPKAMAQPLSARNRKVGKK